MSVDYKPRPRKVQALDQARNAALNVERSFTATLHAAQRFKERCPLAKTLTISECRARVAELVASSCAWGHVSSHYGDFSRHRISEYRKVQWGPCVMIFVTASDRNGGRFDVVVKTVLNEEQGRELAMRRVTAAMVKDDE